MPAMDMARGAVVGVIVIRDGWVHGVKQVKKNIAIIMEYWSVAVLVIVIQDGSAIGAK